MNVEDDFLDKTKLPGVNPHEALEDISINKLKPLFDPRKFEVAKSAGRDKGIDLEIEVKTPKSHTNFKFLLQLKATKAVKRNEDGSVSLSIETKNLEYLLNANSIAYYVHYIEDEDKFLYISLAEFLGELTRKGIDWQDQDSNTGHLRRELNQEAIDEIYADTIKRGKFNRSLNETMWTQSSLHQDKVLIDEDLKVISDAEIRENIEKFGFYLNNEARWGDIILLHNRGSAGMVAGAKYNLIVGQAYYYLGELPRALDYLKRAKNQRSDLQPGLAAYLDLFDLTVKNALGMVSAEDYREGLAKLDENENFGFQLRVDRIKDEFNHSDESNLEIRYRRFREEIGKLLAIPTLDASVRLMIECDALLISGNRINMELAIMLPRIMALGQTPIAVFMQESLKKSITDQRVKWAAEVQRLIDESFKRNNSFSFFFVAVNSSKVEYEFEAYQNMVSYFHGIKSVALSPERLTRLNQILFNLGNAIEYYQKLGHIENSCAAVSLQYEVLHFMEKYDEAKAVLDKLKDLVGTYDVETFKNKYHTLVNKGTFHERLFAFMSETAAIERKDQEKYHSLMAEVSEMDRLDDANENEFEDPMMIHLHQFSSFKFERYQLPVVYKTLNITKEAEESFNQCYLDEIVPIANILNDPITWEGNIEGKVVDNSFGAFEKYIRIRREFHKNGILRIVLSDD